jgi:hypothetical protein
MKKKKFCDDCGFRIGNKVYNNYYEHKSGIKLCELCYRRRLYDLK